MSRRFKAWVVAAMSFALLGTAGIAQAKQGGQSGGSAKQYAPGQQKKQAGQKNAKSYAPGQRKKSGGTTNGNKGAKQYAPGQQKKNQAVQ